MLPKNRIPTHPGEVLLGEFLSPLGLTQKALAEHLGVSTGRISEIVRGKRGVTSETAWMLSGALGTTPQFWMSLQAQYDLARTKPRKRIARLRDPSSGLSG